MSSKRTTHSAARNGQAKTEQIIAGCKALQASSPAGKCHTPAEIASACGVHRRCIAFIERRALNKLALKLSEQVGLLEEVFGHRPQHPAFSPAGRDIYHSGRPAVRPAKPAPRRAPKGPTLQSLVASVEFSHFARNA